MKNKQKQGALPQKGISQDAIQEIKRHFDVVAEKLDDKISTIAEQYGDIKKTLDSHTEMIGSMKEDIEVIKEDVEVMKEDIVVMKEDIVVIKKDIVVMKEDIEVIKEDVKVMKIDIAETKTDVVIIKSDIEFIKGGMKKKVDYDEFVALERRMTLVESKVRR